MEERDAAAEGSQGKTSFTGYLATAALLFGVVIALYIQRMSTMLAPVEDTSPEETSSDESLWEPEQD
jgi:heme/copper-type cytochrome/quinol oxidase subunit 3